MTTPIDVGSEASAVAAFADRALSLRSAVLHEAYYYPSLSLCVIDAIFSINARYTAVENVVARYCRHFGLVRIRPDRTKLPKPNDQETVAVFDERLASIGTERCASEVFSNRQRTSARSGILKAEAVHRFARVLTAHGANYFQDIPRVIDSASFEKAIRAIPGQASGVTLQYFWMLAGSDHLVKPDRQIVRFVQRALGKPVVPQQAASWLAAAAALLQPKYSHLTPRLLDYEAWRFEKETASVSCDDQPPNQ